MSPATIVMLSSLLSFGAPLAFAVYEIWSTRRSPRGGDGPPPDAPRTPKPLPDCLQPRTLLARPRMRAFEEA